MDQNSKESLLNQESQSSPEAVPAPSEAEREAAPESFSVESETANPSPAQPQTDFQVPPLEYTEEEILKQAGEVAQLPEGDRLAQLKSVALKQGVVKAVRIAQKMEDPRLLDELHDTIQDDPELKAQLEALGKLEKL